MSRKIPSYAVIDVETTEIKGGETPKTLFWGYADSSGYYRFDSTSQFLRFLSKLDRKVLLHHSNFDIIQLLVDGAKLQILRSHNGKIIRGTLQGHATLNTYAAFPLSLAEIFAAFGFEKTPLTDLAKRNYEDCVNGLQCFLSLDNIFLDLCGESPLSRGTIAGTAHKAACRFLERDMPSDDRFLVSYRGGRVECFSIRKQKASMFDINSSYPKSILDCPRTGKLLRVQVSTFDSIGPLFHSAEDTTLLFPNGQFVSWVYEDVYEKYLAPNHTKTRVKVLSRHKIDLSWLHDLKHWIETIYETKKTTGNDAIKTVCKFLLNSFYGRIGLNGESERARIMTYRPDGDYVDCYKLGRNRWLVFDTVIRTNTKSNFPFAAYITDNARGRLYQSFAKHQPIYGDTDSVVITPGSFKLSQGKDCGQWSFKGTKLFRAFNVKDYCWGAKEVRKGGKAFEKWTLKQFASKGIAEHVERTRVTELRKREVLPDGSTIPLVVNK